ncbi:MAG: acyl carrier protein [Myxococcaceae bacterium]
MAEQTVDILQLFAQAAMEVNNKKLDNLTRNTVISQLGMDSVAVMELVSYFEEKLEIRLPDDELAKISTIGDLSDVISRILPPGKQVAA